MGGEEEPKPAEQTNPNASSTVVSLETEMARSSISLLAPNPSWFTPKRLLVIFCVINLLNYLDRGAIASNGVNGSRRTCTKSGTCSSGSGIQGDFDLNNFEDGVISSAFMVGLLVASPIFASLAKRLVGVGEASFISLAAPFIDDNAPVAQKNAWLGIFYMCIPSGVALGYVYGGLVGGHFNWRWAFWGEAILMLPFAVLGFVMKPLQLKGFSPAASKKGLTAAPKVQDIPNGNDGALHSKEEFSDQSSTKPSRSKDPGSILNQFSRFLKDMKVLSVEKSNADMMFGGITIVCGVFGTLAGGYVLDLMGSTISNAFKKNAWLGIFYMCIPSGVALGYVYGGLGPVNFVCLHCVKPSLRPLSMAMSTVSIHIFGDVPSSPLVGVLQLLSAATFMGAIFCFSAFCFKSLYAFIALFAIGELLVFATQGPVNFVCLHCVKPSLRPLSMAMSTVSIHIFGDVPSSPLVGVLQLLSAATFMGAIFCFSAFCFKSLYAFIALFAIGELLVFATQGPVNFVCLHCVKPSLRPLSMAMSTVSIHIFGDVPSSPLVGVLQDNVNNWRETALILTSILFLAAGIWCIGIFIHSVDRSNEDSEHPDAMFDKSNTTPLLEEKAAERRMSLAEP
ncbi:unnamed protein product [Ilex paraguariensis]|uniref:Major facilitator superfamily (MFS) profile domain-containing protein n=1 Tax=Ilex paraguariensis TaxID=185542 RepID=A0ABC8RSL5_9AQUA